MAEIFNASSPGKGMSLPGNGTVDLNIADMDWQHSGTDGFWIKPLFESGQNRLKTWLMKIDPGATSPMHTHEDIEQIYVLEGAFYDQHKTYKAGTLIVRAPLAEHTAGSIDGALVIVTYNPVLP